MNDFFNQMPGSLRKIQKGTAAKLQAEISFVLFKEAAGKTDIYTTERRRLDNALFCSGKEIIRQLLQSLIEKGIANPFRQVMHRGCHNLPEQKQVIRIDRRG
jgi:hypothetical protein